MTEVGARLKRALEVMAGKPGVSLAPPASPEVLDRAEQRLGRPLPRELRELLALANGLSVEYGLRQILGLERQDSPDLVEFNAHDTWKYAWGLDELEGLLVFKLTHDLNFDAFRLDTGQLVDGMLPLIGSIEPARTDLVRQIERGWVRMATQPMHPEDEAVHRAVGTVPADQGVFLGPSFFTAGREDPSQLSLRPLDEVLRMSGGLNADANALPPNTLIVAPFCEYDDHGRERWRWITDRDLPGLKEQVGEGGKISHITVDGIIPGHD